MPERKSTLNCFVLMPFSVRESDLSRYGHPDHWTDVYEGLINPAVHGAGFACARDDHDRGTRLIAENVLRKIETADLILCDLSSHNPNVFLELGWALRADKPYVLIKDAITDYNFDLNQQYTFTYSHALRPTQIKNEIVELSDVVNRTINDSERRFSWIQKLSLTLASIKAAQAGDVQMKLLLDIQQNMRNALREIPLRAAGDESFPWPLLLRKATSALAAVKAEIDTFENLRDRNLLKSRLESLSDSLETGKRAEIQFSVVDENGVLVYHDWPDLIGQSLDAMVTPGQFADVHAHASGAVAWSDRSSNTSTYIVSHVRRSIAIFTVAGPRNWKVIVETHFELNQFP